MYSFEQTLKLEPSEPVAPSDDRVRSVTPRGKIFDPCRLFDLLVALLAIAFVAPLLIIVSLAIKAHDGGPSFFAHERIGQGGRRFRCLKFRTMEIDAEAKLAALLARDHAAAAEWARDHKLRLDPRITKLGRMLRSTSLDELPQLFNVISGDMSLVGPRPIVPAEIHHYGRSFRHYCAVPPGITGLWQVSGRNDISYRRRVAMDVLYVRSRSLIQNIVILIMTIPAVISRAGCY